jgi:prepilin-type N-terminal cleavage/methylation domain-containing protein
MRASSLRQRRRAVRAFTLIEILVVVAIIALLVAILLPSLSRARENARAAVCSSNGHQMGLALQMYTSVNKFTPGHHRVGMSVTPTEWVVFPIRLLRAMSSSGKLWILVTGIVEVTPEAAHDVIGIFWVDADGNSSPARRVRTPTSDSDPGDGKHLGIRHGSSRPTLTFIDTDAVRTYRKN